MSKAWQGGSTRAWRTLRSTVLYRDGGMCTLKLDGCDTYANQVHHLDGVAAGKVTTPDRLTSACSNCNAKIGDPTRTDPEPHEPRTNW